MRSIISCVASPFGCAPSPAPMLHLLTAESGTCTWGGRSMAASLRELDEVAIAMLCDPAIRDKVSKAGQVPDRLVNLYIKAINDCLAGAPRYRIVGIHICRGFFRGRYLSEGGYKSASASSGALKPPTFCSSTTLRDPETSSGSASCQAKASCWCFVSRDWKRSTI